jgi:hypothetical protein
VTLSFKELGELFSDLPRLCVAEDHADFGAGVSGVELVPHFVEGVIEVIGLDHEGKVVLFGGRVFLEIAQKVD